MFKVNVIIPARNEEDVLPKTILALRGQSLKPSRIIVVNDCSTDNTRQVALKFNCYVVDFPIWHEETWVGRPELSLVLNYGLKHLEDDCDYFVILGADTILTSNYIAEIVKRMNDEGVVIASGRAWGEKVTVTPRGSGRVFSTKWFKRHIKQYPLCYSWESYPLYYAEALGFKVKVYSDLYYVLQRPTKRYKAEYGYAMREVGYHLIYALYRCLKALILEGESVGVKMLLNYIRGPCKIVNPVIAKRIKYMQCKRLLSLRKTLRRL